VAEQQDRQDRQDRLPGTKPSRRHPSAGNLTSRPELVREPPAPPTRPAFAFPFAVDEPATGEFVRYGPDLDDEALARLIGSVAGKRILDLGCGFGANSIALARAGAHVVAVDQSASRLAIARSNADEAEVRIEFHHADPADLAFVRAERMDACIAVYSVAGVDDVARLFRQVHRVLRADKPFVVSLPHPMSLMVDDDERPRVIQAADDLTPLVWPGDEDVEGVTVLPHSVSDVVMALRSSNFRLDLILEPTGEPRSAASRYWSPTRRLIPSTVIFRTRKDRS